MKQRFVGHCNIGTDIKQASFLGQNGTYATFNQKNICLFQCPDKRKRQACRLQHARHPVISFASGIVMDHCYVMELVVEVAILYGFQNPDEFICILCLVMFTAVDTGECNILEKHHMWPLHHLVDVIFLTICCSMHLLPRWGLACFFSLYFFF